MSPRPGLAVGIHSFGAYVPRFRLAREEVATANAWFNAGVPRSGQRAVCSWDEDAITMGVQAGANALADLDRSDLGAVCLGTTTAPFADRLNSGVVAGALGLPEFSSAQDLAGSWRAGTTALLGGLARAGFDGTRSVVVGSERLAAPVASAEEGLFGHAAAAFVVGRGEGVAEFIGSASLNVDLVDRYRAARQEFYSNWEERWGRQEGYLQIIPRVVHELFSRHGVAAANVAHFCIPAPTAGISTSVARALGIAPGAVGSDLLDGCGFAGAAHALLMLVDALERGRPGDLVLVAGYGQGAETLLFRITDAIQDIPPNRIRLDQWLDRAQALPYPRYLALHDLVKLALGPRADVDRQTPLTAAYRHRDLLLSLSGGRCDRCGTYQIPRRARCVNPDCNAWASQREYSFASSTGRIVTWSSDYLTYTPDPPAHYGLIEFAEGARMMMDFTDVESDELAAGLAMRMTFRIKTEDRLRSYPHYFWKATPKP